jgi:hypothetical protein
MSVPQGEWQWFGKPAHLIVGNDCRFHLATLVGEYMVSTVGEYIPDEPVREILAESRGLALEGRGEYRRASWMQLNGFEEIGYGRTYETMVFRVTGKVCEREDCGCGLPSIDPTELDSDGYNVAGAAQAGHYAMCAKWADA